MVPLRSDHNVFLVGSPRPFGWFYVGDEAVMAPLRSDHNVFLVGSPRPFAWFCGRYGLSELGFIILKGKHWNPARSLLVL